MTGTEGRVNNPVDSSNVGGTCQTGSHGTEEAREAAVKVDRLANIIRVVDGDHTTGAGALADGIADSGYLTDLFDAGVREGIRQARDAVLAQRTVELDELYDYRKPDIILQEDALDAIDALDTD